MQQTYNDTHRQGRATPRLAVINDLAGFGRSSASVILPTLSVLGIESCLVPTAILSNHLGFPTCYFDDYTEKMPAYLHAWKQLSLTFDGLYCGFLSNERQVLIVKDFLDSFLLRTANGKPPVFLLDPVMGDHGRCYSSITPGHCDALKSLLPRASILTPNITEACLLTGTPWHDGAWTEAELSDICDRLTALSHPSGQAWHPHSFQIVITGILAEGVYYNYLRDGEESVLTAHPSCGSSRPGTGDLFASILAALSLYDTPLISSVQVASDFISRCVGASCGLPPQEGVRFEPCLRFLPDLAENSGIRPVLPEPVDK